MVLALRENPPQIAEGWVLDLYCKYSGEVNHDLDTWGVTIYGHDKAMARKEAKEIGWIIHRDHTATCPFCAKMK